MGMMEDNNLQVHRRGEDQKILLEATRCPWKQTEDVPSSYTTTQFIYQLRTGVKILILAIFAICRTRLPS